MTQYNDDEARAAFLSKVTKGAVVPQHLMPYLEAMSDFTPEVYGSCLVYFAENKPKARKEKAYSAAAAKYSSTFSQPEEEEEAPKGPSAYIIGYPINQPLPAISEDLPEGYDFVSQEDLSEAIEATARRKDLSRITVVSPVRPLSAPEWALCRDAAFWKIDVTPQNAKEKKLALFTKILGKQKVMIERWSQDHEKLVSKYLAGFPELSEESANVYRRISDYLKKCPDAALFSLRGGYNQLEGFAIADFSSCYTAFYMFSLMAGRPSPSSTQYLISAIAQEAGLRGYYHLNVGLGTEQTMSFLKSHWKAKQFLPYTETSWAPQGPTKLDKELLKASPKGAPPNDVYLHSEANAEKKLDWKTLLLGLFWPIKRK